MRLYTRRGCGDPRAPSLALCGVVQWQRRPALDREIEVRILVPELKKRIGSLYFLIVYFSAMILGAVIGDLTFAGPYLTVGASGATYQPITIPSLPGKFPNHGLAAK